MENRERILRAINSRPELASECQSRVDEFLEDDNAREDWPDYDAADALHDIVDTDAVSGKVRALAHDALIEAGYLEDVTDHDIVTNRRHRPVCVRRGRRFDAVAGWASWIVD